MLKKNKGIGDLLSAVHVQQKAMNRFYHSKVLQNLIYLAHQGLPMKENWASVEGDRGCEHDSNLHQLMLLRANDDPIILDIMKLKTRKYIDHIQNQLLEILALQHLRSITSEFCCFFTGIQ